MNYSAVWRPGKGAQHWVSAYSFDKLKAEESRQHAAGLRLKILRQMGDDSYLAVWREGNESQYWWAGISREQWHKIDTDMFKKGYRITSLDYDNDRVSVVYHPGTGAQHIHGGISFKKLQQLFSDYYDDGLRLVTMQRMYDGDWDEFMAVWRPGKGGQHWYTNKGSKFADFKKKNLEYFNNGYRLIAFPNYGINAIWSPGSGAQWIDFAVSPKTFEAHDAKYFKEGLRLFDLTSGASI